MLVTQIPGQNSPRPVSPARALAAALLFFFGSLAIGSVIAVLAARLHPELADQRLVRVARRCMMGAAAILLPFFLRSVGSRGLADCGWTSPGENRRAAFGRGVLIGVATLLPLAALSIALGTRPWHPAKPAAELTLGLLLFAGQSLVVGITEETMARGLLFLPMRRAFGAAFAALASGSIFAWAHFMEPSAAALRDPAFGTAAVHTLGSALGHLRCEEYIVPRFVNLVLMSAVLCAAVTRTGSIWLAAGLHAGWVLIKKINAVVSDSAYHHPLQAWLGARSDYLDAWGCTVVLLALLAWLLRRRNQPAGVIAAAPADQSPAMASQT